MKRRRFLKNTSLSALTSMAGIKVVFASKIPENYTPLLWQSDDPYKLFGKHQDMVVLNDKPWNMEVCFFPVIPKEDIRMDHSSTMDW